MKEKKKKADFFPRRFPFKKEEEEMIVVVATDRSSIDATISCAETAAAVDNIYVMDLMWLGGTGEGGGWTLYTT